MSRFTLVPAATLAALVSLVSASPARADHEDLLFLVAAGALLPSEVGAELTARPAHGAAPLIGWSYQLPLSIGHETEEERHRFTFEVDWKPGSRGPDVGGRVGYRYARGPFAVGLGAAGDPDGLRLSPEFLVRPTWNRDFKPHLRVRAEANASDLRGLVTLGWTVF